MTRLLCVRHAETEHNVLRQISTHTHGGRLSRRGRQQAHELALRLSNIELAAVYSSPMERALQTAELVAQPHGLSVRIRDELRELSAGELDGRSDDEAFRILDAVFDTWSMGDATSRIGASGDTGTDVIQRLMDAIAGITDAHLDETVVLVTHGGLLQIAVPWVCSNLEPEYGHRRHVTNTTVIELHCGGDIQCVSWAGTTIDRSLRSIFA
jgi:probable phosphoglycerate mutase